MAQVPPTRAEPDGSPRLVVLERSSPRAVEWAAERLATGGVVAIPTDTVYGIAASLAHRDALRRVYDIKGRPHGKPLPILLSTATALDRLALNVDERVILLLARYWPGPLTAAVPAREGMPSEVLGPDGTIGVRVPNHPLAVELIDRAGGAVAVTSANRSTEQPACTAVEVATTFTNDLDLLIDGGPTPGGVPSTVVSFSGNEITILRDGAIPREHLHATWQAILAEARAADPANSVARQADSG